MGRFGHENGPFWMLAGAVLDVSWGRFGLVFSSIGAVLVSVGRFRPSLGPFRSVPVAYYLSRCTETSKVQRSPNMTSV